MSANGQPSSRPNGAASLVGTIVGGRYELKRVIGEGGMSAVYAGEHVHMHKPVAVKVLSPEMSRVEEAVTRFRREAQAAGRIEHPNVAAATDFGELEDGSFFLVLELVEGRTLREVISSGRLSVARALHVTRQIASALSRAHSLGIIHRDLKPENVMLTTREDDEDFVKVLDFGIAKIPISELAPGSSSVPLTQVGLVYGTPEYMPPEQAMGKVLDVRADLYALGVMLFEMLAGVRPWDDDNKVVLLGKTLSQPVPPIAEMCADAAVPPDVEAIVRKAMEKTPEARFTTADELIAAIDATSQPPAQEAAAPMPPQLKTLPLPDAAPHVERKETMPRWKRVGTHLIERAEAKLPLARIPLAISTRKKLWLVVGAGAVVLVGFFVLVIVLVSVLSGSGSHASASAPAIDHRARCLAASAAGDQAGVIREAVVWSAANPQGESPEIARAVEGAAADQEAAAFELLEKKLGHAGADALYDLAYGPPSSSHELATHAKQSLQSDAVKANLSPALAITVSIRSVTTPCDAKKYFQQAALTGDSRTVDALTQYLKKTGCGRRGRNDCYACLRVGSDSVEKTMAAIRVRADAAL